MSTDLQSRFEAALRRALGTTEAGAPVVNVEAAAAPVVHVSPVVRAEMPALPQPLEVLDVARHGAAFEYDIRPVRDAQGFLINARLVPVALVHFGEDL
jgi:hypothetical protein